jgi:L-fucose isomerase-like protein
MNDVIVTVVMLAFVLLSNAPVFIADIRHRGKNPCWLCGMCGADCEFRITKPDEDEPRDWIPAHIKCAENLLNKRNRKAQAKKEWVWLGQELRKKFWR